jgi:hypothetical protein
MKHTSINYIVVIYDDLSWSLAFDPVKSEGLHPRITSYAATGEE